MNPRVLDGVRGLAAVYVVAFHATNILWVAPAAASPLVGSARQVLGFGHEAVLLFFAISGFCIHSRQARAPRAAFDLRGFAWRRIRRLYPPLLLALAVTAVCDSLGAWLYQGIYTDGLLYTFDHSPTTLLGNLLFQADLGVPVWGSNGPLWSLAHEFWFYALYPLVLFAFRRLGPGRATLLLSGLSLASNVGYRWLPAWPVYVLSEWGIWVAGALIAELYVRRARPRLLRLLGPVGLLLLVESVLTTPRGEDISLPDFVWGAYLVVLLAYALLVPPAWLARAAEHVAERLRPVGDISYSLYLLHQPWLLLLGAAWLWRFHSLPSEPGLAALGLVGGLAIGGLGWRVAERPCMPAGIVRRLARRVPWRAPWRAQKTGLRARLSCSSALR
jgi:peptidoglycan/LPS O-acetylase OafA/YrhL